MEPNKERIREWVRRLRSGDYQQIRKFLRNPENNGFCCLGVACQQYLDENKEAKSHWRGKVFIDKDYGKDRHGQPDREWVEEEFLPPSVYNYFGLDKLRENKELDYLYTTEANDGVLYDFELISNLLEQTYLKE